MINDQQKDESSDRLKVERWKSKERKERVPLFFQSRKSAMHEIASNYSLETGSRYDDDDDDHEDDEGEDDDNDDGGGDDTCIFIE